MSLVPYTRGYTFEVYRPELIPSRLEPTYGKPKDDEWRPSLHYKHRLRDVKNQYTPAEYYRHRLKTSGAHIRMIQRLEMRWARNPELFNHAALTVQRVYRGVLGRRYFAQTKELFYDDMLRRRYTVPALEAYKQGDYETVLSNISLAPQPIGSLLTSIRAKSLYRIKDYHQCIQESINLRSIDPQSSDGYYFHALSLAQLRRIDEAYELTRECTLRVTSCGDDIFRLSGGLAVQLKPPNFDAAIDAYGELLRRNANDFDAVSRDEYGLAPRQSPIYCDGVMQLLARACAYSCLQEWSDAMADVQTVLAHQPVHRQALLLRARIHACNRRWPEAEKDYKSILYFEPTHEEALQGVKDTVQFNADDVLLVEN